MARVTLVFAILGGCAQAQLPTPAPAPPPQVCPESPAPAADEILLLRGVQELATEGKGPLLATLVQEYPDSAHAVTAASLLKLVSSRDGLTRRNTNLQHAKTASSQREAQLAAEITKLRHSLSELERLTIEMERKAK